MLGRYSLDVEGLAYAGGEWDASRYSTFAEQIIAVLCRIPQKTPRFR